MVTSHSLPRRRPVSPSIDTITDSMKCVSLRKGSTFQVSPSTDSEQVLDPFLRGLTIPTLPNRSATCPKSLEDLLIGAGERRAVELLRLVDDAIAKNNELSTILSSPEVLPVPRFMIERAALPDSNPANGRTNHAQDKDSGIGSSIISTGQKLKSMSASSDNTTRTAVNRSIAGSHQEHAHRLSEFAQKQVHRHIVDPILAEPKLKDFHALIRDVPTRIGNKDIRTLRDLEKTLIFLAPDYSSSPFAYRSFCEISIRRLHLAVATVHESDRCLPTDRPYSTNYFIDLVEQIRRYASILAATRAKDAQGEPLDETDARSSDEVELKGGLTHNGKPGFLVRRRGSKYFNMATNKEMTVEQVVTASVKRPMVDLADDDDSVQRSMARRKKNAPIRTYYCNQEGCTKNFKRPCDLTKHIKTHERPWKCPEENCKYHEIGWPTEKECQRHMNDKHSDAPTMYKCLEPDCPYTSKRESNCKQHMEKAHNIPYVRSKSNGKGKAIQRLPKDSPSAKTDSIVGTPLTPPAPSPSVHSSISGDSLVAGPSTVIPPPAFDFADFSTHFNTDYLSPTRPMTPSWTQDHRTSTATSVTTYSPFELPNTDFDVGMIKTEPYDFTMYDTFNTTSDSSQVLFPNVNTQPSQENNRLDAVMNAVSPNITFGAQDQTFGIHFNDAMAMDSGFNDFDLFNDAKQAPVDASDDDEMFGLDNMGEQFNSGNSQSDLSTLFPEIRKDL